MSKVELTYCTATRVGEVLRFKPRMGDEVVPDGDDVVVDVPNAAYVLHADTQPWCLQSRHGTLVIERRGGSHYRLTQIVGARALFVLFDESDFRTVLDAASPSPPPPHVVDPECWFPKPTSFSEPVSSAEVKRELSVCRLDRDEWDVTVGAEGFILPGSAMDAIIFAPEGASCEFGDVSVVKRAGGSVSVRWDESTSLTFSPSEVTYLYFALRRLTE